MTTQAHSPLDATKVAVVGGTSGIGEATAARFAALGAAVVIGGRDASRIEAAAARIARVGKVSGFEIDGADAASARRFFERVGEIDHLVLALSGGKGAGPIATLALDDLRSGFEAKLFAHLTTLQAALPFVRSSITFVSAISARAALAGTAGLAAINGAVESLVRPLANELAPRRVNAVSPGVVDTPWWDALPKDQKDGFFAQAQKTLPVGRVGRPEDVAEAIVMVATNGFMTGTVLEIAGGAHLAR
ncbi:short-chain dehydrogenase/reductase SDR [Minicystis rosea]|nr:short-chain dehydrogenase/reductase SDR [Minicystis rosea]